MNYARYLNAVSAARKPSPIRLLTAILARSPPSMISLAAGSPNPDLFPFESAEIKLTWQHHHLSHTTKQQNPDLGCLLYLPLLQSPGARLSQTIMQDGSSINLSDKAMKQALQYGPTQGNADLLRWLKELQSAMHAPPTLGKDNEAGGLEICVTTGSQDGICKSLEMLVSPGDNVIIDTPCYAGTLAILKPLGCNILAVDTDQYGMKPNHLREILSRWNPDDKLDPSKNTPKIMYTIPNGVNPTGASLTEARKREIYEIARQYDMLILEDDPYYFLQFEETRIPSLLSMDTDGRVIRFDSFSKILSSGLRVGFVSGPQPLVNRVQLHMMASVLHTATMSQVLISELFNRWGITGFLTHVDRVVEFYRNQKNLMIESATKHLQGLAEWDEPKAGMFLWMKLTGIEDTKKLIEEKALEKEVLLVPGCAFMPDSDAQCPYVRASYSLASQQQIDQGLERLAALIRQELGK